jgi:hypothetical protein
VSAERGAEGARRAVADAFRHLGQPEVLPAEQILATAIRQASRYSIGGKPMVRAANPLW